MLISIITATRNAAGPPLRHCLSSLAGQTLAFEHVIVDGSSTDGTVAIVEDYVQSRAGNPPPPRFISEPDQSLYAALNKGLRMAAGDVVGILHADDVYASPQILAKVAAVFADPAVDACYGDLLYVKTGDPLSVIRDPMPSGDGVTDHGSRVTDHAFEIVRYWQSGPYAPEKFTWGWMPPHPTFFVRREIYDRYGMFRLDLGTAADYELMLRFLFRHRIRCAYLPEILVCMRAGGISNRSLLARLQANRMDRLAWRANGLRLYPWTIPLKPLRKIPQWWRRP